MRIELRRLLSVVSFAGLVFGCQGLGQVGAEVGAGVWTRQTHSGGETWTYTFNVPGGEQSQLSPQTSRQGATQPSYAPGGLQPRRGDAAEYTDSVPQAVRPAFSRASTSERADLQRHISSQFDIAVSRVYLKSATTNGFEISPVTAGQLVYLFVDFSVTGTAGTPVSIESRALFDGQAICAGTANFQYTDGAWSQFCSSGVYATAGQHTVRWDFNYDRLLPEANLANDSLQLTFTPVAGPIDLVAQRASMRTAAFDGGTEIVSPNVGDTVFFTLDWFVNGAVTPLTFDVRAVLDGATYCAYNTSDPTVGPPVAAGPWVSWCGNGWVATPGTHTLRWDLDYNNVIAETNESNNTASRLFTPGSSDGSSPDSGWWWDPNLAGTGFFIEHGGKSTNGLFIGAFLYDGSATATWLVSTGPMVGNTYNSTWLRVRGGQTLTGGYQAPTSQVATSNVSIVFSDSSHGVLTRPDGSQIHIQRFSFCADPAPCLPQPGTSQGGWYWAGPDKTGTGFGVEFQGTAMFAVAYVYTPAGDPIWYLATGFMSSPSTYTGTWDLYGGGPMLSSPEGTYPYKKLGSASTLTLKFTDATHAVLTMNGAVTTLTRFQEF